jgi:hypothetical protein
MGDTRPECSTNTCGERASVKENNICFCAFCYMALKGWKVNCEETR